MQKAVQNNRLRVRDRISPWKATWAFGVNLAAEVAALFSLVAALGAGLFTLRMLLGAA